MHRKMRIQMKSYDDLRTEIEAIQVQMVDASKNACASALKETQRLRKKFNSNAGMLRSSLANGRKKP